MFGYRSVQVDADDWAVWRKEEAGVNFTAPQQIAVFGPLVGNNLDEGALTGKQQADACAGGIVAAFGGIFDPENNEPFE